MLTKATQIKNQNCKIVGENDLKMWTGSFPQNLVLIRKIVCEKRDFTDDRRTPAPQQ